MYLQVVYIISVTVLHTVSSSADNCTSNNLGIIGGHTVKIEDVPFIVALYQSKCGKFEAMCGGSIVHERFVLTAAHCLASLPHSVSKRVLVGSDRLNAGGIMIDVEAQFCHKEFNATEYLTDICLLKLSEPVPLGCKVAKVTLPDEGYELEEGTMVNVTGWGDIGNDDMENNLYQTATPIVSEECCRNVYDAFNDDDICAGTVGHDACQGDSGGPLTYNGVLVGIVSYGDGCGENPGVYTKVASYLDWIETTIQDNL